jgi:hypothetical protein
MIITKIIPPQTRTIFISIHKHFIENYKEYFQKFKQFDDGCNTIFKFKLNMPQMKLDADLDEDNQYIYFYPYENYKSYVSPLLNTSCGKICLGKFFGNIRKPDIATKEILNEIYNSPFNFDRSESTSYYITKRKRNKNNNNPIDGIHHQNSNYYYYALDFYQNWQDTGKLELIN